MTQNELLDLLKKNGYIQDRNQGGIMKAHHFGFADCREVPLDHRVTELIDPTNPDPYYFITYEGLFAGKYENGKLVCTHHWKDCEGVNRLPENEWKWVQSDYKNF